MKLSKEDIAYCDQAVELEQECSAGAVTRCRFTPFIFQCVYRAHGDGKHCLAHYLGRAWPHLSPKDYERLERAR